MRCLLLSLLLLASSLGRGEALPPGRIRVRAYTEEMGLRSQNVQALAQDRDGILYVGTASGLFRFGGGRFSLIPLRKDVEAPMVLSLMPHPDGGMWVGTINGLALVHGQSVRWATMEGTAHNLSIYGMALDGEGRLWFADRRGMFRQTGPSHFQVDPATSAWNKDGYTLAKAPYGGVVVLQGNRAVHRFVEGRWESRPVPMPSPDLGVLDAKGRVWILKQRKVFRLDPGASSFVPHGSGLPSDLADGGQPYPDAKGGIWFPLVDGLLKLSDGPPRWLDRSRGLPDEGIFMPFMDREGNLWCAGAGLYRILGRGWSQTFDIKDGLAANVTWSILRTRQDGRLLVGSQSGLTELVEGRFQTFPGTQGMNIAQMVEDHQGTVWLGTRGSGLLRILPGARRAIRVKAFGSPYAGKIALASDGRLYVNGNHPGLLLLTPQRAGEPTVEVVRVPRSPSGGEGVSRITVDPSGRLWASAWYGLLLREKEGWRTFTRKDGLRQDGVQDLVFSPEGDLWVRYEEPVGVSRLRFEAGSLHVLEHLSSDHGIHTSVVFGMLPGAEGDFWMLTDRGVIRRHQGILTTLTTQDGLPTNDCDEDAVWRDPDGTVWVGTSNGLVRLDMKALPGSVDPLGVRLVAFQDAHRTWLMPIEAPPGRYPIQDATFTFRFGPKTFADEGSARYQVRLDGLEEDWRTAEGGAAIYTKLREGSYVFRVRASRQGERWGEEFTFAFQVLPPWYRTWWSYTIGGLLLGGLVLLWIRLRLRSITRQRDLLEAQVQVRTREIELARADLEVANDSLKAQSLTDPLTGLRNRRYLQESLPQDVLKVIHLHRFAGRNDRRGWDANPDLVFLLVDLDHFKRINDTHGHHAGDVVLRETAVVLQEAMRDTDAVVRWGGEEFLVVARETNRTEGVRMAERIRQLVEEHAFTLESGVSLRVTCSVGFAPFPLTMDATGTPSWERAVDLADAGLYLAKRSGRNGWVGVSDVREDPTGVWSMALLKAAHEAGAVTLEASFPKLAFEVT